MTILEITDTLLPLIEAANQEKKETIELAEKVAPHFLALKELLSPTTESTDTLNQGSSPDTKEAPDPLAPETIAKDLKNRRQKGVKGSPAFGKVLPQVEVAPEDVEKALGSVPGVTTDYLNQHGFLTHVYRNAALRTETNIEKFESGLFIKFE